MCPDVTDDRMERLRKATPCPASVRLALGGVISCCNIHFFPQIISAAIITLTLWLTDLNGWSSNAITQTLQKDGHSDDKIPVFVLV